MREWVATIVVVVVAIGLIWTAAVILKLVPVFDSGSVEITRAAKYLTPGCGADEPKREARPSPAAARPYSRRQDLANAAIAASRVRSATTTTPCSAIRARNDGPI